MHVSVLLEEVVNLLVTAPGGTFVDATVGAGGHASALLRAAGPRARLLGLDADLLALDLARRNLADLGSAVVLVQTNFRHLREVAVREGFVPADGVLLDLGLSSMQLADESRGFSFRGEGNLDMRFDPTRGAPASRFLNEADESEIARVLWTYGEEPGSRRIARQIVRARPLHSAADLTEAVRRAAHPAKLNDALARVFQAVRIFVNEELEALAEGLEQGLSVLSQGGRLAVISFHSLEDRTVKQFMKRESSDCLCPAELPVCACGHRARLRLVTRKVVTPRPEEVASNPRSRSAKLRVAERL